MRQLHSGGWLNGARHDGNVFLLPDHVEYNLIISASAVLVIHN